MPSLLDLGTVDFSLLPVLIGEVFNDWCSIYQFLEYFINGEDNYSCGQTGVVSLLGLFMYVWEESDNVFPSHQLTGGFGCN